MQSFAAVIVFLFTAVIVCLFACTEAVNDNQLSRFNVTAELYSICCSVDTDSVTESSTLDQGVKIWARYFCSVLQSVTAVWCLQVQGWDQYWCSRWVHSNCRCYPRPKQTDTSRSRSPGHHWLDPIQSQPIRAGHEFVWANRKRAQLSSGESDFISGWTIGITGTLMITWYGYCALIGQLISTLDCDWRTGCWDCLWRSRCALSQPHLSSLIHPVTIRLFSFLLTHSFSACICNLNSLFLFISLNPNEAAN